MLWVAAFLALIIWILGMASDFLGLRIHLFLLFAILAVLVALLPARLTETVTAEDPEGSPDSVTNAKSVPGAESAEPSDEAARPFAE